MKERLKSKVDWIAVLSQICIIVALFIPEVSDTVKIIGSAIIEILTLIGILNNPTTREKF